MDGQRILFLDLGGVWGLPNNWGYLVYTTEGVRLHYLKLTDFGYGALELGLREDQEHLPDT